MKKTILAATLAILVANSATAQSKKASEDSTSQIDAVAYLTYKDQAPGETGLWATLVTGVESACANCHMGAQTNLTSDVNLIPRVRYYGNMDGEYGTLHDITNLSGYADLWHGQHNILSLYDALPNPHKFGARDLVGQVSQPTAGALLEMPGPETRRMLDLPEDSGIIVRGVCEPLSKDLAGLKTNDIVLQINDKPASSVSELDAMLATKDKLAMVILRDGEKKELNRAATKAAQNKRYLIGVTLGELDPVVRAQMKLDDKVTVFVRDIAEDGAAKEAGLQPNDIFVKINEKDAPTIETVRSMVQNSNGEPIKLRLRRAAETVTVQLKPRLTGEVQAVLVEGAKHRIRLVDVEDKPHPKPTASDVKNQLDEIDRKLAELTALLKSLKSKQ